ncbi:hypothetical protein BIZ37_03690 [Photobacterium sp. BZF1]|uniref:hypothetical protein n=1 Tax=Photobacterium TaxID=657 RepID=UPI00165347DD|nr:MULTISPECIES: hypothetical protein [Photobacterium]MBC7001652.1 hypothetical protein [Photobacterium sp. BZF1]MBY5945987.1 hypothetical protein [Photobacterium rosenbergii]
METSVEFSNPDNVVFDYTTFLSASCKQRVTLVDALKALIPAFEITWTSSMPHGMTDSEKLQLQALKVLSTNISDTNNLIRLLRLARAEHIDELMIKLPYALEEFQLVEIESKAACKMIKLDDEGEVLRAHML